MVQPRPPRMVHWKRFFKNNSSRNPGGFYVQILGGKR